MKQINEMKLLIENILSFFSSYFHPALAHHHTILEGIHLIHNQIYRRQQRRLEMHPITALRVLSVAQMLALVVVMVLQVPLVLMEYHRIQMLLVSVVLVFLVAQALLFL